ncbi:MAG: phosphotransferase [Actinocatenispora sp.]
MVDAAVRRLARDLGLGEPTVLGSGLEFMVHRTTTADHDLVLRSPLGPRFQSNANDPNVDTRALLSWEYAVTGHLVRAGFPVATPHRLVLGEPDALVSEYVPDDGAGADPELLGRLLRTLHRLPPPAHRPVACDGLATARLIPHRIGHRWRALRSLGIDLPADPRLDGLAELLDRPSAGSLLHLDVRAANLRAVDGRPLALLDWSNALVGDPALDLGRLAEFARLPDNGLDHDAVLAGYGDRPSPDPVAGWAYRLDAAVMLAVVFLSEAPDETRGVQAADRLREVWHRYAHERDRRH